MKNQIVKVTDAHIQRGSISLSSCPVALALNEATGKTWRVGSGNAWIGGEQELENLFSQSEGLIEWIKRFDRIKKHIETYHPGLPINLHEIQIIIDWKHRKLLRKPVKA